MILSAAISADGFLDDARPERLRLSSDEDWAAVKELRRTCDAILVGAETVRKDNPSLREAPLKVILSRSGRIPKEARIFADGEVLITQGTAREVCAELAERGVKRLMVEGGAQVLGMFLGEGMFDKLRLAVAPIFVGSGVRFPAVEGAPMHLERVEQLGQMAVMWFASTLSFRSEERGEESGRSQSHLYHLARAIELSRLSEPCATAYRVGAVIVTPDGQTFEGYTHETSPTNHAEEEALLKATGVDLKGATIYVSMEPCSTRASKPVSCSELLIKHGFRKVVFALSEPPLFAACTGARMLAEASIEVVHAAEFSHAVKEINKHLSINNP